MTSNYPEGVTENMIPGNRPEDVAFEKAVEEVNVAEVCADFNEACMHATILRQSPDLFCGCYLHVTEITNDDVLVVGKGDPNDCPFYQTEIERVRLEIMDGTWGRDL